ncbi:MAG: hypothetical protein LBJ64_00200 [Deltaproteobacteria bacterium]|nr:hypothetical protein [Deltaproteobacteria bacterium]
MPRIAFELDLPDSLAKAADEKGLLSSQAMLELLKREVANTAPSPKAVFKAGHQPWMDGVVAPELMGRGKILVADDQFIAPIEAEWEAAGKRG